MSEYVFICYPKCTTCKKAENWLKTHNISFQVRDIKLNPPTINEIGSFYKKSGLPLKRFFNTSGLKYKELGLSSKLSSMTEEEQIALLASDGMLIKRPIFISKNFVLVGFNETLWEQTIL
jgi:arsenate reductase